jgi:hypothetical protein
LDQCGAGKAIFSPLIKVLSGKLLTALKGAQPKIQQKNTFVLAAFTFYKRCPKFKKIYQNKKKI